ncbi:MAG TPA: LptA/OstA family protein [Woeseiaceae bacterium]
MRYILPGVVCALLVGTAAAQDTDVEQPIAMDAESAEWDRKTSMQVYHGLRLTQGDIAVQADVGRGSDLDFDDSAWHLSGNVVIEARDGRVECDTADLEFRNKELRSARITGSPATFELRRPDSDATTHAQAEKLVYDFTSRVVEFSGDAVITEGGNSISSDYLVYNIAEQRIKANPGGQGKVRVRYTPADSADRPAEKPEDAESPPDQRRDGADPAQPTPDRPRHDADGP